MDFGYQIKARSAAEQTFIWTLLDPLGQEVILTLPFDAISQRAVQSLEAIDPAVDAPFAIVGSVSFDGAQTEFSATAYIGERERSIATMRSLGATGPRIMVHFLAQIPYGIGAYYLGKLGTTVGWGLNIGMALMVATALGFLQGEWTGASRRALRTLQAAIAILIAAIAVLAYANSLA